MRDPAQLAGEAKLAEGRDRRRSTQRTERDAAGRARHRERHGQIGARLIDANATDDVDEHVRSAERNAAVACQHGKHQRQAVSVQAIDHAARRDEVRGRHQRLHLHQQRTAAFHRGEHDAAGRTRRALDEAC